MAKTVDPPLPEGFVLQEDNTPPLPPGFVLQDKASNNDSIATQGLGYLKEHPFKSLFQGLPETITGKSMEQRSVDYTQNPKFGQSDIAPFDKNIPNAGNVAMTNMLGGQAIDMATAPANAMGPVIKSLGKATGLTQLINTVGKPLAAKTMSIFSGIPSKDVVKAIDNPEMLSSDWLKKEGTVVKDLYQTQITPALENMTNRVTTTGLAKTLDNEIKLITNGEPTRAATTMSNAEKQKIIKWLDDIKKGDISLNKSDAIIGEIDKGLGKVYRKSEQMKLQPVSSTFEALSSKIRSGLSDLRNTQYPDLAKVWGRYADYKNAQRISESFNKWSPRLMDVAKTAGVLTAAGLHNPVAYGLGATAAIPKVQGLGIELGSGLGKIPGIIPAQVGVGMAREDQ